MLFRPYQMTLLSCSKCAEFDIQLQKYLDYGWEPYGEMHSTNQNAYPRILMQRSKRNAKKYGDFPEE